MGSSCRCRHLGSLSSTNRVAVQYAHRHLSWRVTCRNGAIASLLTSDASSAKETLRVDEVIRILREKGDTDLRFLDSFDDPGPPTELHHCSRPDGLRGTVVVTTNFDSLIERASLMVRESRETPRFLQIHDK